MSTSGIIGRVWGLPAADTVCWAQETKSNTNRQTQGIPLQLCGTISDQIQRSLPWKAWQAGQGQEPLGRPTRTVQKNRIPNKLRINVKPLIIDKENPTFVRKWNDAICKAKLELTKIITEHLQDIIQWTIAIIYETTEKTYHALQAADIAIDEVEKALEDTLKEADYARKSNNKARQKRKLKAAANNQKTKKNKKDQ